MAKGNYKHAKYIIVDGKKTLVSPGMGNAKYWEERSKETLEKYYKKADNVEKELEKAYKRALKEIKKEYESFFLKYGEEGKNTLLEARKYLSPKQRAEFIDDIGYWEEKYMNYQITDKQFKSLSSTLKNRTRIQRLEELNYQVEARLAELAWKNNVDLEGLLSEAYKGTKEDTRVFFNKRAGISSWNKISEKVIQTAIKEPWAPQMWSDNIWNNRYWTTEKLKQHITTGLLLGENPTITAKKFEKVMVGGKAINDNMLRPISMPNDNSYFNSRRLIQTETKHILTKSSHETVIESGVEGRYIVVTVFDKRRSKICEKKEGTIIELKDANTSNMSPYHPFCRSFEKFEIRGIDYDLELTDPPKNNNQGPKNTDWYKPKSAKEALEELKKQYPNSKITIGRLDAEIKERTLNNINKLSQMYNLNNGKDKVIGISIASKDGHGKAFSKGTGGVVYTNRRTGAKSYGLNTRYFKNAETLKEYYDPGWSVIIDEDKILDHTTYHEFGHLIYTSHGQNTAEYKKMQEFFKGDTYKEHKKNISKVKTEINKKTAAVRDEMMNKYRKGELSVDEANMGLRMARIEVQKRVIEKHKDYMPSIYAAHSDNELIAEAFAEYHLSSTPGKLAMEVGELMDNIYGRKLK